MNIAMIIMGTAEIIFLILATVYAAMALKNVHHKKHKHPIMIIKQKVFILLMISIVLLLFGMTIQHINEILGIHTIPTIADIFLVPSFILMTLGFTYFWKEISKLHKLHPKDSVFVIGVASGVFIWLYYLFRLSIIPSSASMSILEKLLHYFYPIIISIMFLMTLRIQPTFKAGIIRTPLWYISHGVFTHFIGYMMYVYYFWNNGYTWFPVTYTAIFLVSAIYFTIGFYSAKKKYV